MFENGIIASISEKLLEVRHAPVGGIHELHMLAENPIPLRPSARVARVPLRRRERISESARAVLAPHFPELDLGRITLRRAIPRHVRIFSVVKPAAYTSGCRIYFDPSGFDPFCARGIPFLAHELVHVRQFQQSRLFRLKYLGEYVWLRSRGFEKAEAYMRISYEIEAASMEERVRRELEIAVASPSPDSPEK